MLSEANLELLTAFVDGELTRRQRKAVLRLLHQSSAARSVLQDLQENAHRLRELPHHKMGHNFAGQVVQAIAHRGLRPAPEQPLPRRRLPRWAQYAVAASILLALGMGIYLATHSSGNQVAPGPIAAIPPQPEAVPPSPLHVSFKELAAQPRHEILAKRLQKEPAIHLDVTVHDGAMAFEHLKKALKGQGIQLIVDAKTHANLKKPGRNLQYLVFAENVDAEELQKILRQLAQDPKGQQANNFESMVVSSVSPADRRNVSGLLGLDELDGPRRSGDGKLFEDMIISKDNGTKPAPTPQRHANRYAVVLAANLGNLATASPEVKMFLDSRQRQRPGTLQVVLVIHTV